MSEFKIGDKVMIIDCDGMYKSGDTIIINSISNNKKYVKRDTYVGWTSITNIKPVG